MEHDAGHGADEGRGGAGGEARFSHLDEQGRLQMVDVTDKRHSVREALAAGEVHLQRRTLELLHAGALQKGDVLACARVAGISAAKRTAELIPLCHPIALSWVDVRISVLREGGEEAEDHAVLGIEATAKAQDATGVEMEALTAVSVAALTIYDMCKAVDKGMRIERVRLLRKTGGKSDYRAEETSGGPAEVPR